MTEYQDARRIAAMLAALGEPTRIKIAYHLTEAPRNVGELADLVGIPMVNMSHHLGVMRTAGLLDDQKDGRKVVYQFRPAVYTPGGDGPDVIGTLTMGTYRLSILRQGDATKPRAKAGK